MIIYANRRMFLKGLGGVIAIPVLESLIPSHAFAAGAENKKRFIAITTPNQWPHQLFFPANYPGKTPPADLAAFIQTKSDGLYPYRQFSLASVIAQRGQISPTFDSQYNAFASKMALWRGLDFPGRVDHGRASSLGNTAGTHLGGSLKLKPVKTIDEFMLESKNFYTNGKLAYRFPSLRLGEACLTTNKVSETDPLVGFEIGGNNAGLTLSGNLKATFDAMYADMSASKAKVPVVDRLLQNINASSAKRKMGTSDKQKLDEYMSTLSDLELSINANNGVQGPKPGLTLLDQNAPPIGGLSTIDTTTPNYYSDLVTLITLAIKVGATKIATVGIESAKVTPTLVKSQNNGTTGRNWHVEIAHAEDDGALQSINKWVCDNVFLQLMNNLNVVESGSETYLDNTMIMMTSEFASGHSGLGMGGVIAGNTGKVGLGYGFEYTDYSRGFYEWYTASKYNYGPGQPMNRLWVGLMQAVGLTPADYLNKYGNGSRTHGVWVDNYPDGFESMFGNIMRSANIDKPLAGLFT